VRQLIKGRGEPIVAALVITLVLMGLAALVPAAVKQFGVKAGATPAPAPSRTAAPAAVLLPDELDRALQGVMTIVNEHTFATAFLIDTQGDFLTASSLVVNSPSLRLIDNTGGMHSVRLLGIDAPRGIAMVRAAGDGIPLVFGDGNRLQVNDPLVLLASPKIQNLQPATPAVLKGSFDGELGLRVDTVDGNLGGPVVGPGGKAVAILTDPGIALLLSGAQAQIAQWRQTAGTVLPLAPLPGNIQLRGSESTSSPTGGVSIQSIAPNRASAARETLITIKGTGFVEGAALRVRFIPLANAGGQFDGLEATLVNASSLTVRVPAGRTVQDYVVQLTNGDGALINSRVAFTLTP
jgi:hypothetical protein